MSNITVEMKVDFIQWVLNNYRFKKRECVWILNYLMANAKMLEKVHFVDGGVQYCPRGVLITADVDGVPFRYYKESLMTTDAERAFHDIRLNRDEDLYIYLNFTGKHMVQNLGVIEVNTFVPEESRPESKFTKEADKLLTKALSEGEFQRLVAKIDEALISGDEETFLILSKEYKKAKTQYKRKYKQELTL